jgi:hypothetical protein
MKRNALVLVLIVALPGCHRRRQEPETRVAPLAEHHARQIRYHGQGAEEAGLAGPAPDGDEDGGNGGGGGNDGSGARYRDPMIYVDGEPRASFTYNEMPAEVKVLEHHYDAEDGITHRMLVCDYFHALGADCNKIKETHWYQGRGRVAIISGEELRRFQKRLFMNFTKDLSGKPRVEWHGAPGLSINERPDLVANVAIYIAKKPPVWSDEQWALVDDRGVAYEGMPYAHEDGRRGVRVNVDGIFKARLKRNLVEGNLTPVNADAPNETPRYRLLDFLAAQKVALNKVRGVDLVVREERVVRVPAAEAAAVQFTALKQQHGEMMFYFGEHYVPALAVDVWARSNPPTRPMRTVTLGIASDDRGRDPQAQDHPIQARR